MNNEKYNQIVGDAYKNYLIEDAKILPNMSKEKMTELGYRLTQEEFINKCKTDPEFSEKWGLKIEERELSFNRRYRLGDYQPYNIEGKVEYEKGLDYITQEQFETFHNKEMDKLNIPTKLITIIYNNETIESYE